jgi:hypothetical protein
MKMQQAMAEQNKAKPQQQKEQDTPHYPDITITELEWSKAARRSLRAGDLTMMNELCTLLLAKGMVLGDFVLMWGDIVAAHAVGNNAVDAMAKWVRIKLSPKKINKQRLAEKQKQGRR